MTDSAIAFIQSKKEQLADEDTKTLMDFDRFNTVNNCTECTRYNQTIVLIRFITTVGKNFKDITREDIERYLVSRKVKPQTLDMDKIIIKKFYKWKNGGKEYPETVEWITLSNEYNYKTPSDLLTELDIKKLLAKCDNLRDRVVVSLLDDTGIRIGELVGLNVGDVHNDGEHLSITVTGKTGTRTIGLILCSSLVNELLNQNPEKNNPEAPLFTYHNKRISDNSTYAMLQYLKEQAGIKKKVHPHIFRHTTLTRYAKLGMNEYQMCIFAGWELGSQMAKKYCHMTEKQVDDNRRALMTGQQPEPKKVEKSNRLPLQCPRCNKENDSQNNYCVSCWLPLHRETVDRDIQIINAFKSKFTRMVVDVDTVVKEYYQFKSTTNEYLEFYNAFGGKLAISMELLFEKLQWTKSRFERFVNGLVETGILKIEDGVITIQSYDGKTVFENFILFQKML